MMRPIAGIRQVRGRVGVRSFERMLHVISGVFGALYSLQTLDSYFADGASLSGVLGTAVQVAALLSVLTGLVGTLGRTRARRTFTVAFAWFALALLLWPLSIDGSVPASPMPWLVALAPVGLVYLIVACRRSIVSIAVSTAMGVEIVLALVSAGHQSLVDALTDGGFVVAVSLVLVLLLGGVRRGVADADAAQQAALAHYESSRLDSAIETERVRTDAFVHDSVLMTLLGAAGAHDAAAEALVARMAGNALTVLDDVQIAAGAGKRVPFTSVLAAADPELLALTARVGLTTDHVDDLMLPERVARAMVDATLEAIANSIRHAGRDATRRASIETFGMDGVRVLVEDDGCGFDIDAIPPDRHGVRESVVGRMHEIAGRVRIDSAVGRGTRVELSYGSYFNAEIDATLFDAPREVAPA